VIVLTISAHTRPEQLLVGQQRHVAVVIAGALIDVDDVAGRIATGRAGDARQRVVRRREIPIAAAAAALSTYHTRRTKIDCARARAGHAVAVGDRVGEGVGHLLIANCGL